MAASLQEGLYIAFARVMEGLSGASPSMPVEVLD
jgi:hypothetical protein